MSRNLSPQIMFQQMAANRPPANSFKGRTLADFKAWRRKTLPHVKACIGLSPDKTRPNPKLEAEWSHDGLRKQRWLIDVQPEIAAVMYVNIPGNLKRNRKLPAIMCWHGHGPYGKEPVMGNDSSAELRAQAASMNYAYGHAMAKAGYVTYAIDWIGCGERNDETKPNHSNIRANRDWCNLYYLHATMLGMTSLSINLAHGMAATDFAAGLPFVDSSRLGVMGLSGGGAMTLWSALCDNRFKAAEIICYSDLWAAFGLRDVNYCGMQVAPGLLRLVDLPDLQGLLAPMPLLLDIGVYDSCFKVDTSMECYRKAQKIYRAAGAAEVLELDLFPGEHGWGGNRSVDFFGKHL